MLTVHHLGISQSDRIVWLCEELAVPYRLIRYERDPVTKAAPPEYRALHPFGTAPTITDGDLVLAESGAIIEYIIAKHGGGRLAVSADRAEFPDYLYWFHFANGSFMPSAMVDLVAQMLGANAQASTLAILRARGDRAYAMIESRLGTVDYFAGGEFTAADLIMFFPLTTMRAFVPRDLSPYPKIRAYLQRVGARPAYRRAMAKADPGFTPPLS
ncbi:MAG TPA: glutathione S-transferase family protein [Steroidobacteraceae bacterium]|nr:glutathione S-transferase family protein [Steroidobacteraceae bacterium]